MDSTASTTRKGFLKRIGFAAATACALLGVSPRGFQSVSLRGSERVRQAGAPGAGAGANDAPSSALARVRTARGAVSCSEISRLNAGQTAGLCGTSGRVGQPRVVASVASAAPASPRA